MPKDSNSFKLRFQYYKQTGKLPYKAGRIDGELMYRERMKDVARENYEQWGYNSPADAWQDAVNDPTYDYRGYYSDPEFQNMNANSQTHWPDRYKTPFHRTFSSESKYHGEQSEKNPYGLRGGQWVEDKFIPAAWLNPIRIPHYAGGRDGELPTDAVLSRQMPIELQQDPLGMLKRLDIARANAAKVTAMLNQALVGTKTDVSQLLQNYYADKEDTRKFMERKRTGEELADKIMGTALDVATLYVPAARVGWNMMKGAAGALKSGVRAAARGTKNVAETLRYGTLGKPRVSKDYTDLVIPNIQELSLYLKPSSKQTRIIKEDTYPTYIGPKHSVSEVVNADGTVNPRAAMRILHEVADNIPGAYRMENRLENPVWHLNDPTTYHHTRDVARRAWRIDTPSGYTKQDLMIAALGHDFGKIVTGDGHAKIGADLLRQIFPDITDLQLLAIREHMGQNLTTPLSVATKRADNIVENPSGLLSDEPLKNMERVRKEEVLGSDFDLDARTSSREGAVPYSDGAGQFPVFKGFNDYPHLQFDFNTPANSLGEYVDSYLKSVDNVVSPQITRYDYDYWKTLSDEQKLDAVSQIVTHPEYNILFRIPKPGYKNYLKRDKGGYLDFYGDSRFKDSPNYISERPGKIILDEKELSEFLGETPKKLKGKLTPPKLSKDRVDWTNYREALYNKILEDWEHDGPLSAHLKRSGLTPTDVMDYMITPEQAWYNLLKNSEFDIVGHIFKKRMIDDALKSPLMRSAFERSINKVLRGYNVKQPALKIEDSDNFLSKSSVVDKITEKYDLSITRAREAFDRAFNYTLKSDVEAAEDFFTLVSENFNNAFASPSEGVMFIPANRNNFTRVVSHELGHLEDIPHEYTSSPTKGIFLSNQSYIAPSADTPLFKNAFDFSGIDDSTIRYFTDGGKNATEMAQRFTQLADELKLKPGEQITPEMLEYMRDNYITLTGMNNNMEEFFKSIKNIKLAAKWGSIFHKALIPFMIGGTSLSIPQLNNTKQ